MNKTLLIILVLLVGLIGIFVGKIVDNGTTIEFGAVRGANSFSAINITENTTTSPMWSNEDFILDNNPNRQAAWICTTSTALVMLHYVVSSTVEVDLGSGFPISATNTAEYLPCHFIGPDALYLGEVKAIAQATTTLITTEVGN